jgi:hypothetical protein
MFGILLILAAATAQDTNFSEHFEKGNDVDLSQGFYICRGDAPLAMQQLAPIKDPAVRERRAESMGCERVKTDQPAVVQVLEVQASSCGALEPVNDGMMCGAEAHRLLVRDRTNNGPIHTVILFGNDIDYN